MLRDRKIVTRGRIILINIVTRFYNQENVEIYSLRLHFSTAITCSTGLQLILSRFFNDFHLPRRNSSSILESATSRYFLDSRAHFSGLQHDNFGHCSASSAFFFTAERPTLSSSWRRDEDVARADERRRCCLGQACRYGCSTYDFKCIGCRAICFRMNWSPRVARAVAALNSFESIGLAFVGRV